MTRQAGSLCELVFKDNYSEKHRVWAKGGGDNDVRRRQIDRRTNEELMGGGCREQGRADDAVLEAMRVKEGHHTNKQ